MKNTVYMSRKKFNEEAKKLKDLKTIKFPKNREAMRIAIETGGGMHDNASYEHAAMKERVLLIQISELEQLLSKVKIIDNANIDTSAVNIGTQVKVRDLDSNEETQYVIASAYGADSDSNTVSYLAPLAKGLIGKKVEEIVEIQIPKGKIRLKILSIKKAKNW
ncbi:Transcription elongation factor GreA [subsurface metagenome]